MYDEVEAAEPNGINELVDEVKDPKEDIEW